MAGMSVAAIEERREWVVELSRAGWSAGKIAAELGITRRSVERIRSKAGITAEPAKPFSAAELARAEAMLADGASIAEVARSLGRGVQGSNGGLYRRFAGRGWDMATRNEHLAVLRAARKTLR